MLRASLALLVTLLSGCGRAHALDDGTYRFVVQRVFRDDCGLAGQSLLSEGRLVTAGDSVSLAFTQPEARLAGTYRLSVEEMTLDGTIANFATMVRGEACLLDFVTLHLDTVTRSAASFGGTMSIAYYAPQLDACVCKYWFDFDATRTGP